MDVKSVPKYNEDGEYLFTWYTTKFRYVILIKGADFIDCIQPIIYDNGTWVYNGSKIKVPGNITIDDDYERGDIPFKIRRTIKMIFVYLNLVKLFWKR